jgi:hypothetical protein
MLAILDKTMNKEKLEIEEYGTPKEKKLSAIDLSKHLKLKEL